MGWSWVNCSTGCDYISLMLMKWLRRRYSTRFHSNTQNTGKLWVLFLNFFSSTATCYCDNVLLMLQVYLFVFHGRMREAIQLLMQHNRNETKPFAIIIHLLNKMPVFNVTSSTFNSLVNFKQFYFFCLCDYRISLDCRCQNLTRGGATGKMSASLFYTKASSRHIRNSTTSVE